MHALHFTLCLSLSLSLSVSLSLSIVNMGFWVDNYFVFDCCFFCFVFVLFFARGLDEKKYIVLIPLPSLIKNSVVRSFVLSLSLSLLVCLCQSVCLPPPSPSLSLPCLSLLSYLSLRCFSSVFFCFCFCFSSVLIFLSYSCSSCYFTENEMLQNWKLLTDYSSNTNSAATTLATMMKMMLAIIQMTYWSFPLCLSVVAYGHCHLDEEQKLIFFV